MSDEAESLLRKLLDGSVYVLRLHAHELLIDGQVVLDDDERDLVDRLIREHGGDPDSERPWG